MSGEDPTGAAAAVPGDDPPDYGFAEEAANSWMHRLVHAVAVNSQRGEVERHEALQLLSDGIRELAGDYPDAVDITVRENVLRELDPVFDDLGWTRPEAYEF